MPGKPHMSLFRPFLLAGLLAAMLLPLAEIRGAPDDDNSGVVIHQDGQVLVYPPRLLMEGVPSGQVRVVLSVDARGKLADLLIVGYTNPEFASAVAAAMPTWTYEPARVHGQARAARIDVEVNFKSELNVLVVNAGYHVWELVTNDWRRYAYRAYKLSEIDKIPTPVHVVQPVLPKDYADRRVPRSVTVEFFIDEKGTVRVPTVDREDVDSVFAGAMVAAVEQWKFEPPTKHGEPVLVLARQEFKFPPRPGPEN